MMKIRNLMLGGLVMLALGAGCGERAPVQPESIQLKVAGMHCEGCAQTITRKLKLVCGVLSSDLHFSNEVQTVNYDGARAQADQLVQVITNLGYTVEIILPVAP